MEKIEIVKVKLVKEKDLFVNNIHIKEPKDCYKVISNFLDNPDREHFIILGLSTNNKICVISTISIGTLNSSLVHPREVFKIAILSNCSKIIISHNHPSGNLLGINILDHIIVSDESYFSFKENELLF
ncbi:TPA: JAB domain-containing protein [Clostridioides difficile]|uniref:JAB domain-containing protein n=1 Tax=Clostridioides difficile TaxID=1496 RepID=UPI0008265002|nr:JAB domain-containing protein [Clostridioides difficile]MDV9854138.1 JAB domain-containing protein [Clostridioides difficile]TGA17808.1 DNA repair protein RadC [Clostridioides difficile]TGA44223.1 DNA repair protein RadC [Clostridioides difficile]HBE9726968.1 JAB domain-containing protein [Clostridioides difficile]HBF1102443.1 JAB domain-containing protein [Clostridioides difficile]